MEVQAPPRVRPGRAQCRATRAAALAAVALAGTLGAPRATLAQRAPAGPIGSPLGDVGVGALVTIGSVGEDRTRLAQLLGDTPTAGFLLRTPSALSGIFPGRSVGGAQLVLLQPEALVVRNSALDTPGNDGALWAGRGVNVLARGGAALRAGRVVAVLVPEVAYSQNLGYQSTPVTLLGQKAPTGPFAAPWFTGVYSADLPLRFGDQSYTTFGWGQSTVYVDLGRVAVGLSTENQWWGPGARNALVLGSAAEGFPHAFVRTARPLRTRLGDVEARWEVGALTRSIFFNPPADHPADRAISGLVATLRARADTGLTVGLARLVLAPVHSPGAAGGHAFDVFTRAEILGAGDTLRTHPRTDQMTSVFARWAFPGAGAEVYGEFARLELPRSVRDFFLAPLNTGAYTLGLARAWRLPAGRAVRANLELSDLEQSRPFSDRPQAPDYYTGRATPAGFTNRGQVLGAAIGPGSQSQWLAVDYFTPAQQAGLFLERTRNQNDALYRQPFANFCRHDVTLGGGVRYGRRLTALDVLGTLSAQRRDNYLFQSGCANYLGIGTVDVHNVTFGLSLSPRVRRAPR